MIGIERDKVTEYVKERILALRAAHPGQCENVSVVRTNSMKYIPNYFEKGQLSKMFFLFPDPHFKEKNHRRRVISPHLLDEYAYALAAGGIIYTITNVEELGEWMKACLEAHPMFEALTDEELEADPVVKLLSTATEEGQKVARNGDKLFKQSIDALCHLFDFDGDILFNFDSSCHFCNMNNLCLYQKIIHGRTEAKYAYVVVAPPWHHYLQYLSYFLS